MARKQKSESRGDSPFAVILVKTDAVEPQDPWSELRAEEAARKNAFEEASELCETEPGRVEFACDALDLAEKIRARAKEAPRRATKPRRTRSKYDYFVQLNNDKVVAAFDSVEQGLASMEAEYNRHHRRSYEGSMSACINYLSFQRALVACENVEDLKKKLLPHGEPNLVELSHVSGFMFAIRADTKKAKAIWDKAAKPALITEDVDT